ncbi:MAG TPA: hypothetical protein VGL72_08255 [Bryobacteraceae bacterium]|jgi:hypothetical protein
MASKLQRALRLTVAGLIAAWLPAMAQERIDPANSIKFDINDDAPIQVASFDAAESRVSSRGGAQVIDLHVLAKLKNRGRDTIRSVTLLLVAGEATPGGKMASSAATANVAPGDTFDMRIDGRLMRPVRTDGGPLVRVKVDGVLFKNYDFYGPDLVKSHRQMLAWAMEADRDRKYFKQVLLTRGKAGLQQEMLESLSRQSERPQLDVQLSRGRATTSAALQPDKIAEFAFLQIPDSPIKPTKGWAEIAHNEARSPQIEIQNTSSKSIRYVEVAWLVKDLQGKEYFAGSVPASEGELYLPPGRSARLLQDTSLRFSSNGGRPVDIQDMRGFVSEVEYSDHNIWVPKRETLQHSDLWRVIPPSPEEQHLTSLYLKSIDTLIRELNKF